MIAALLLLAAELPRDDDVRVAARVVEGVVVVDASATSVLPLTFLRELAGASGLALRGEELLAGASRIDVTLVGRSVDEALDALSLATLLQIRLDGDAITVAPARRGASVEDLELDAEMAWLGIVRDQPDQEPAREARFELGRIQERRGHDDAALVHYDSAADTTLPSPAAERGLEAASAILMRHQSWGEAMQRLTRLAQVATDAGLQLEAREQIARVLAEQGRGSESLALVDAIDLSWPPADEREALDRRLLRARGLLAADNALEAMRQLDVRAARDPQLGGLREDLELRARALAALGAPREAARAWLANAVQCTGAERDEALFAAAELAFAGEDDLCVLFIERMAQGGTRAADVARVARAARERIGIAEDLAASLEELELRWRLRASLQPSDRAALASRLLPALDRTRGIESALELARTALSELDGADAAPVRRTLAEAYERRGLWAEAARAWGGTLP